MNEPIQKNISVLDELLAKHFSRDNDKRHDQPWDWEIGQGHDELEDEQIPHGERVGTRRMATALRALARKRGVSSIPKWVKLMELTSEELNALGEQYFGDEWPKALAAIAGGASNNVNVKDVPDEALATEDKGPVNQEASKARNLLRDLARRSGLSVKDVEALSDQEVLRITRELG